MYIFTCADKAVLCDVMPGHVKKSTGPDPDPDPWLVVSDQLKTKLKAKPYDAKKSCWVPNKATGGYLEGLIESTEGDKVTVTILESKDVRKYWIRIGGSFTVVYCTYIRTVLY